MISNSITSTTARRGACILLDFRVTYGYKKLTPCELISDSSSTAHRRLGEACLLESYEKKHPPPLFFWLRLGDATVTDMYVACSCT